jgi:hypothetical protein
LIVLKDTQKFNMKSLRGSDGAEVVDSVADGNMKSRKSSAFRPQSEWDVEEEDGKGKQQSEWNDGNSDPQRKSGLSNIFKSEWDVEEDTQNQQPAKKASSWFRPQSEWDDGEDKKQPEKSRVASSFRPQSEWDDGGETKGPTKSTVASFRPQSEWDIENEEGKLRGQSEWDVGPKARKASSFRPHSEWETQKPKESFQGDSFILGKSVYKSEYQQDGEEEKQKPQSEWDDGAKPNKKKSEISKDPSFRPQSEWNDGAKPNKKKSEISKDPSFRPQSEWNDGASKKEKGKRPEYQKEESFRPRSEWSDGAKKNEKGKKSHRKSDGDDKQDRKTKSRGKSEGEKERPQSEWGDGKPSSKSKSRGKSEGEKERPQSEWGDEGGGGGGGVAFGSSEWDGIEIELPLDFRKQMQELDAYDPVKLYSSKDPFIAEFHFSDFDAASGLPRLMGGGPITPRDMKVLKQVQKDMSTRYKQMEIVRSDCADVLAGSSQLKVGTIKTIAKELARIEAAENYVLDPRTMFTSNKNFTQSDKRGHRMAMTLYGGMFSGFDAMGRPTAGRIGQGLTIAPPFSNLVKGTIFKMHKDQAQKFLDFYKPILDGYHSREIADYFRIGEYAGAFKDYTGDGLPLSTFGGKPLSNQEKETVCVSAAR